MGNFRIKPINIIISLVIFAVIAAVLLIFLRPTQVTITDEQVIIGGMTGQTIEISEIRGVSLLEQSFRAIDPSLGGSGTQFVSGSHSSPNLGNVYLYVNAGASPTIWIELEGRGDIYISFSNAQRARDLYEELRAIPIN